jgi:predicted MFS family arabinose efflux permease
MDGVNGYKGWRWIFILEGALTCLVSFGFFFLLPDFPERATWLTPEEKVYVTARLQADQGPSAAERKLTARDVVRVFTDPKIFVGGVMYFGMIVTAYGYAYFSPSIIQSYGYSQVQTQLHSVPPWAAAFVMAMLIAYASDKCRHRFAFAVVPLVVAIAGFGMLLTIHHNLHAQYAALFLVAMGAYSSMPVLVCWFNMNLGGHHRRAVGSAWQIGFGNTGRIVAVFAFLKKDAPEYKVGYSICVSFAVVSLLSCGVYLVLCAVENRSRDNAPDCGLAENEKAELGDMSPEYRYLL